MRQSLFLFAILLLVGLAYFANGEGDVAKETAASTKTHSTSQGTVADRQKLVQKLFTDYKKAVNPDKPDVKFGLSLLDFHVCDEGQILKTSVWLKQVWQDSRLAWNKEDFGGVDVIRYDSKEVWRPDVTLYNSADPTAMMTCWESNVLIYASGEVLWVPPCKLLSMCKLSLKKEPYGEQTCSLKFGSWTFDGITMDLNLYKNQTIDMSDLSNSSGFEIVSTTAERHSKTYSCCEEPYLDLTFNMTIKRIPGDELVWRD